jgi:hypothetical protein
MRCILGMNRSEAGKLGYQKSSELLSRLRATKHEQAKRKFETEKKVCQGCGVKLPYEKRENRFCSKRCFATHANPKKSKSKVCKGCDENVFGVNTFCTRCISEEKHIHKIKSLELCKTDKSRRNFLLRNGCHKCSVCENSEWNGKPIPIELDHINGDHTDNRRNNLRLICPNCHAQTPTYKNKNKGNGRPLRRARDRS